MSVATQTMKKFVNAPEDVVKESLAGLAAAHADLLRVDFEKQIVVRKDAPVAGKVGLISGGVTVAVKLGRAAISFIQRRQLGWLSRMPLRSVGNPWTRLSSIPRESGTNPTHRWICHRVD